MRGSCLCEECSPDATLATIWLQGLKGLQDLFQRTGFKVEAWGRCPYISQGDAYSDYYYLDDAVFVLSKA